MNIESIERLFLKMPSIFIVLVPYKTKRYAAEREGQTYRFLFCGFGDTVWRGRQVKLSESRYDIEKTGVSKGGAPHLAHDFALAKSSVFATPAKTNAIFSSALISHRCFSQLHLSCLFFSSTFQNSRQWPRKRPLWKDGLRLCLL